MMVAKGLQKLKGQKKLRKVGFVILITIIYIPPAAQTGNKWQPCRAYQTEGSQQFHHFTIAWALLGGLGLFSLFVSLVLTFLGKACHFLRMSFPFIWTSLFEGMFWPAARSMIAKVQSKGNTWLSSRWSSYLPRVPTPLLRSWVVTKVSQNEWSTHVGQIYQILQWCTAIFAVGTPSVRQIPCSMPSELEVTRLSESPSCCINDEPGLQIVYKNALGRQLPVLFQTKKCLTTISGQLQVAERIHDGLPIHDIAQGERHRNVQRPIEQARPFQGDHRGGHRWVEDTQRDHETVLSWGPSWKKMILDDLGKVEIKVQTEPPIFDDFLFNMKSRPSRVKDEDGSHNIPENIPGRSTERKKATMWHQNESTGHKLAKSYGKRKVVTRSMFLSHKKPLMSDLVTGRPAFDSRAWRPTRAASGRVGFVD